jgi:hypothetical protein
MTALRPEQGGMAAVARTMLANTGQMLSIAIAFPLVLSRIPEDVMTNIFLYGGGMSGTPDALHTFISGLHQAFIIACVISLVAAAASILQPSHAASLVDAAPGTTRPAASAAEHD